MKKGNNIRTLLFFVLVLSCTVFHSLSAQWSTNPLVNNAISTFLYYNKFVPAIVSDGAGGAIMTWEDSRDDGSFFDIYAQRINASGVVLWTADGVAISTGPEDKRAPAIVSDGAGGAIITWNDSRTGYGLFDIYSQRINSSGVVQWTTDGVAVCTVAGTQESQSIASDGSGGAIITWEDQRSGSGAGYKIYAQRIDANGSIHAGWTSDGVAICSNLSGSRIVPTVVGDGSGGAMITWSDYRSLSNYDIYAQKINASGDTAWTANGVAICTFVENQGRPKIITDGSGGAIISWIDNRTTNGDIYAQRINSSGTVQWTANGVIICSQPTSSQSTHNMITDGSGGAIISWQDNRSFFNWDIYVQKVNASGVVQWTADGVPICTAANDQQNATIVNDGGGGAIISWHDQRNGGYDIYAQKINTNGDTLWTADGVSISTNSFNQLFPTIASDGANGAIITWYDYRAGNSDIYASQIDANGSIGAGPLPVELVSFVASSSQHIVALTWKTATEINNYGFEIEKTVISHQSSVISWSIAGFVDGNGTTNSPKEYSFSDKNLLAGKYSYRLKQIDRDGKFEYSQAVEVTVGVAPKEFALLQNYPNPFNPTTNIEFTVPANGKATLKVFNVIGQEVATLFDGIAEAGQYHQVTFTANDLSSGIYFARLESDGRSQVKKLSLLR